MNGELYEQRRAANRQASILYGIIAERGRQDDKWPEQAKGGHPNGTGDSAWKYAATQAQSICSAHAKAETLTWLDVLREEVFEAFAEFETTALRRELVQVAAVAIAWLEHLDRTEETAYGDAAGRWLAGEPDA